MLNRGVGFGGREMTVDSLIMGEGLKYGGHLKIRSLDWKSNLIELRIRDNLAPRPRHQIAALSHTRWGISALVGFVFPSECCVCRICLPFAITFPSFLLALLLQIPYRCFYCDALISFLFTSSLVHHSSRTLSCDPLLGIFFSLSARIKVQ